MKIVAGGLQVMGYSGYDFKLSTDRSTFVEANNAEAIRFVEANRFGAGYGYTLTSISQREFASLRSRELASELEWIPPAGR
jgi:hypothetical protein